jgi:sugar phosphate isomerase/epimerase
MDFFVSTTAFRGRPLESVLELARSENLSLEFSSGIPHRPDLREIYLGAQVPRLPHNYFPAPQKPFVLNIASCVESIWERSLEHCKQGLELASLSGARFFSAHAGFCLDPDPSDLGKKFSQQSRFSREEYWQRFLKGIDLLAEHGRQKGVEFLVENNVVIRENVAADGSYPLLCAAKEDMERLDRSVPAGNFGFLLDTAHLKVSANALGFDPGPFVDATSHRIRAVHHSDNDGQRDTNQPINENYWFLPYMRQVAGAAHVLEVHDQSVEQILRQRKLLEEAL